MDGVRPKGSVREEYVDRGMRPLPELSGEGKDKYRPVRRKGGREGLP
jgi:hypothetical protein